MMMNMMIKMMIKMKTDDKNRLEGKLRGAGVYLFFVSLFLKKLSSSTLEVQKSTLKESSSNHHQRIIIMRPSSFLKNARRKNKPDQSSVQLTFFK